MPLWGNKTTNEAKPKYLSSEDKIATRATKLGWVFRRPDGTDELLVAIGGLSTSLAAPNVSDVFFANTAASYVKGNANGFVTIAFNENITVTGSPTIAITGSGAAGNTVATYASGSGSNKLLFKFTVPAVTQNISIGAQSIALAGGTLKDAEATDATLTVGAGVVRGVRGKAGANSVVAVA